MNSESLRVTTTIRVEVPQGANYRAQIIPQNYVHGWWVNATLDVTYVLPGQYATVHTWEHRRVVVEEVPLPVNSG